MIVIVPPVGMIPGVPAVVGVVLLLFSVQFVFGKKKIWLPQRVRDVSIARSKLRHARMKTSKWLERLDMLFTERLTFLTGPVMERVAAIVVTILAILMVPLELIPGLVAVPGWAVIFFGVALMAKDGLFMALALAASLGTFYVLIWVLPAALA
jgi:hypothetical protein